MKLHCSSDCYLQYLLELYPLLQYISCVPASDQVPERRIVFAAKDTCMLPRALLIALLLLQPKPRLGSSRCNPYVALEVICMVLFNMYLSNGFMLRRNSQSSTECLQDRLCTLAYLRNRSALRNVVKVLLFLGLSLVFVTVICTVCSLKRIHNKEYAL